MEDPLTALASTPKRIIQVSYQSLLPISDNRSHPATLMSPRSERLVSTPLDWLFYLSIFNNIFCLFFAFAGMLNSFKEFVLWFFIFNAAEVVLAFHFFVDVWTDNRVGYSDLDHALYTHSE